MNNFPSSAVPPQPLRSECFAEDLRDPAPTQAPSARSSTTPRATATAGRGWFRCAAVGSVAWAVMALGNPAWADNIVSYTYAGVVDHDEAGRGWLSFTGQIAFDRTTPDSIADPSTADYKVSAAPNGNWPNGFNVTFNTGESVSFNHYFDILVSNNLGGYDQWGAQAHDGGSTDSLGLTLTDFSQSAFGSDALPLPAGGLTLSMFTGSEFKYEAAAGLLSGHLTDLTCVAGCDGVTPAVPEPHSLALMLAGLGAMGLFARRRRPV